MNCIVRLEAYGNSKGWHAYRSSQAGTMFLRGLVLKALAFMKIKEWFVWGNDEYAQFLYYFVMSLYSKCMDMLLFAI